ncbi:MAG: type II toxin-antitoxin system VapC family toxin [Magnetococcus sp. DMHC-1]
MSYLLDTDILSELRKRECNPGVKKWLHAIHPSDLFLSVVTIGEVERGIIRQKKSNPQFAAVLAQWMEDILVHYQDRILPIDTSVARHWGNLCAHQGHGNADLLIAATAWIHELTVVTRNTRHFAPSGVAVLDPFTPSH